MSKIESSNKNLNIEQIEDLRLAASKMLGEKRREFQASIAIKYCQGSARKTERVLGWNRKTVKLGLAEKRSGIICKGAQAERCGDKRWEEKHRSAANALVQIAEAHGQQDPTFKTSIAYTRLTAAQALEELKKQGYPKQELPAPSTIAVIFNRLGYRLRPVMKAKPQKKLQKPMPSSRTSSKKTNRVQQESRD